MRCLVLLFFYIMFCCALFAVSASRMGARDEYKHEHEHGLLWIDDGQRYRYLALVRVI